MGCTSSVQTEPDEVEIEPEPQPEPEPKPEPKREPAPPKNPDPPPEPEPEPEPEVKQEPPPPQPKVEAEEEAVPRPVAVVAVSPPDPEPAVETLPAVHPPVAKKNTLDVYDLPRSNSSIAKQNKRRSEIRAQMREYRRQMLETPNMTGDSDEDDLYSNFTGENALEVFRQLFEMDSVWTGVAEWHEDGTSLGLEFTVTSVPDDEGQMSVSRLYHVARGRSRRVDDIRIYEETVMVERVYNEQLVFEYKEETPEGLDLILRCAGREEHNEIHLKRAYVKGIARKRKSNEPDSEWVEGTFDFVRTFFKQAGRIIKQNSLDFSDEDRDEREDSTARITKRISRYSQQFMREIETGRSSGIPDGLTKDLTTRSVPPQGLLSPQEIDEARHEDSRSSSSSF